MANAPDRIRPFRPCLSELFRKIEPSIIEQRQLELPTEIGNIGLREQQFGGS
jgi:hypothetical protein